MWWDMKLLTTASRIALLAPALLLTLNGCIAVATTAATETAVVIAQERSVGNAVDDAGVLAQIKHLYLQKDINDLFANVLVKVVEGRVLLTGNVDKVDTQIDAVRLAWRVNGVREVINEIQINDKTDFVNYAKDVWISTQISGKMLITKDIRSLNYSTIVVNQEALVMGIAQDRFELDRAINVIASVSGVTKVTSYVRLKTDQNRPN